MKVQPNSDMSVHGFPVGGLRQAVENMLGVDAACAVSPRTIKAYRGCAELLLQAISGSVAIPTDELSVHHLTGANLSSAFTRLSETHSAGTVRLCWTVANRICDLLQRDGRIPDSPMGPIPRPKPAQPIPAALTDETVIALLQAAGAPATRDTGRWPQRDLALIALMLTTGVTTDQSLLLRTADLEYRAQHGSYLRVPAGSSYGSRPVPPLAAEAVHRYLHTRARKLPAGIGPGQPAMFIYADGRAMGPSGIRYAIARAFHNADIEDQRPDRAMARALHATHTQRYLKAGSTLPEAIDEALTKIARTASSRPSHG